MNHALLAPLAPLLDGADHVDVKTVEGDRSLREFLAAMFSYQPGWITFLYHLRGYLVRLLGMRQEGVPQAPHYRPADVPMTPGLPAAFFTVQMAEEERFWAAAITESHLSAALGVVVEPLGGARRRFHVVTIVHYNSWAGPIYFNVIRPFHHLVVEQMARAGVKGEGGGERVAEEEGKGRRVG